MPWVDALLDKIESAQVLSTLNLTNGHWQITLATAGHQKTAFATTLGLYQFTKMPFGLHGAATSSQRVMDKALGGVQDCAITYIENILVFSPSWEAHLIHLRLVLEALRKLGLTANFKKSQLGQTAFQYLGFCISRGRTWAVPDKVPTLGDSLFPHTKKDFQ